ncbi:hypothetical protein ACFFRR_006987 [Megaselia abdita]
MINGNQIPDFYSETQSFNNSVFQVSNSQTLPYEDDSIDPNIVDQYLEESAMVSSQEVINGVLFSNGTGLSEILNQVEMRNEVVETKPQVVLNYSMAEKWSDIGMLYNQMKLKTASAIPEITDLQNPDVNFQMNLPPSNRASKYFYSDERQLFIKGDVQFHFKVSFKPTDDSVKFIRLMPVIPSNISKPVVRCENHASKDHLSSHEKKYNVIHSDYPEVIYEGSKEGRSTDERLSIVFPLPYANKGVGESTNSLIETTIPIQFVCQTSCIGRDDVAVICTLENSTEILARKTMQVKICSCPKRDVQKKNEELRLLNAKSGIGSGISRKRPMQSSSILRFGEGKRIKTEVLSASPPPLPPNNNAPETFMVNIKMNHFISCPEVGLQFYNQNLLFFCGLKALNPEKSNEYQPIINDFMKKIADLKKIISALNTYNHTNNRA